MLCEPRSALAVAVAPQVRVHQLCQQVDVHPSELILENRKA